MTQFKELMFIDSSHYLADKCESSKKVEDIGNGFDPGYNYHHLDNHCRHRQSYI